MKASKELVQHISATFWYKSNKEIAQCLEDFKGNPLREEHPIERVNAKYPNGWYCKAFEEVREDSKKAGREISISEWEYSGWFSYKDLGFVYIGFNDVDDSDLDLSNVTLIPKSEYLAITRGVEQQQTIHAEKSSDIEERVKALESKCEDIVKETSLHIEAINKIVADLNSKIYGYCDSSLPKKRNLSIDTPTIDWKKVECLSYEDVIKAKQDNWGLKLGDALEIYIKNKLKK